MDDTLQVTVNFQQRPQRMCFWRPFWKYVSLYSLTSTSVTILDHTLPFYWNQKSYDNLIILWAGIAAMTKAESIQGRYGCFTHMKLSVSMFLSQICTSPRKFHKMSAFINEYLALLWKKVIFTHFSFRNSGIFMARFWNISGHIDFMQIRTYQHSVLDTGKKIQTLQKFTLG